jgi:hypothetical protein
MPCWLDLSRPDRYPFDHEDQVIPGTSRMAHRNVGNLRRNEQTSEQVPCPFSLLTDMALQRSKGHSERDTNDNRQKSYPVLITKWKPMHVAFLPFFAFPKTRDEQQQVGHQAAGCSRLSFRSYKMLGELTNPHDCSPDLDLAPFWVADLDRHGKFPRSATTMRKLGPRAGIVRVYTGDDPKRRNLLEAKTQTLKESMGKASS